MQESADIKISNPTWLNPKLSNPYPDSNPNLNIKANPNSDPDPYMRSNSKPNSDPKI